MKNIKNIDLNLLLIFSTLCQERNTTKVSEILGLSQPGISHALARLRELFGDPLFVRASRGLTPTDYALEIEKPVRAILDQVDNLIYKPAALIRRKLKIPFELPRLIISNKSFSLSCLSI